MKESLNNFKLINKQNTNNNTYILFSIYHFFIIQILIEVRI